MHNEHLRGAAHRYCAQQKAMAFWPAVAEILVLVLEAQLLVPALET